MKIAVFSYPFIAIGMTSSRVMQGLLRNAYAITTMMRVILISVPYLYILFILIINHIFTFGMLC